MWLFFGSGPVLCCFAVFLLAKRKSGREICGARETQTRSMSTKRRKSVKTRERRGSSFSQLGLEPNRTGLTAQSLFFLEESCRVKRSDTHVFKLLKLLQKSSQASKTFFQLLQIKRLQLKLTNNLQNSYQISSQHQVPKTWVKQHPKSPKNTNKRKSISKLFHAQTGSICFQIGSYLVPIGSYGFYSSQIGSYKLKMVS